jgi:hypothetical protein
MTTLGGGSAAAYGLKYQYLARRSWCIPLFSLDRSQPAAEPGLRADRRDVAAGNGAYCTPSKLKKSSKKSRTEHLQEQVYLQTQRIMRAHRDNHPRSVGDDRVRRASERFD